jgi:hypothetical protein
MKTQYESNTISKKKVKDEYFIVYRIENPIDEHLDVEYQIISK